MAPLIHPNKCNGNTKLHNNTYIFCDLCVCYYSNIEVKRSFLDIYCVNCLGKLYKFSIK